MSILKLKSATSTYKYFLHNSGAFQYPAHSLGLVVLELDVQAVLDADLHFDAGVHVRVLGERVHGDVHLTHQVRETAHDRHAQKVPGRGGGASQDQPGVTATTGGEWRWYSMPRDDTAALVYTFTCCCYFRLVSRENAV